MQNQPPRHTGNFHHAGIPQKLGEITAHRLSSWRIGGTEIDQQHTETFRGVMPVILFAAVSAHVSLGLMLQLASSIPERRRQVSDRISLGYAQRCRTAAVTKLPVILENQRMVEGQ